jgi:hypothetical protein
VRTLALYGLRSREATSQMKINAACSHKRSTATSVPSDDEPVCRQSLATPHSAEECPFAPSQTSKAELCASRTGGSRSQNRNPCSEARPLQIVIERRQGQAHPCGDFEVSCVVNGETLLRG